MLKNKPKRFVAGCGKIGDEFGRSAVTIRRWANEGILKGVAFKPNGNTSPWTILVADIERLRQQMKTGAA